MYLKKIKKLLYIAFDARYTFISTQMLLILLTSSAFLFLTTIITVAAVLARKKNDNNENKENNKEEAEDVNKDRIKYLMQELTENNEKNENKNTKLSLDSFESNLNKGNKKKVNRSISSSNGNFNNATSSPIYHLQDIGVDQPDEGDDLEETAEPKITDLFSNITQKPDDNLSKEEKEKKKLKENLKSLANEKINNVFDGLKKTVYQTKDNINSVIETNVSNIKHQNLLKKQLESGTAEATMKAGLGIGKLKEDANLDIDNENNIKDNFLTLKGSIEQKIQNRGAAILKDATDKMSELNNDIQGKITYFNNLPPEAPDVSGINLMSSNDLKKKADNDKKNDLTELIKIKNTIDKSDLDTPTQNLFNSLSSNIKEKGTKMNELVDLKKQKEQEQMKLEKEDTTEEEKNNTTNKINELKTKIQDKENEIKTVQDKIDDDKQKIKRKL